MDIDKYDLKSKELIEKIYDQKRNMSENVFASLHELMEHARKMGDDNLQGFAHFHLADALFTFDKDYSQFRENLARAVYFFQMGGEQELLARTFNYVAIDALNNGSYDVAYLYLMNALKTCEKIDNDYLLGIINNNIGEVFARMHSYDKAVGYVKTSNKLQERSSKDDYYYYQNMINGCITEGVLYAMIGNTADAEKSCAMIEAYKAEGEIADDPSIFIPIALLKLMISILKNEEEEIRRWSAELVRNLSEGHRIFDIITNIEDLCHFLLDHNYLDIAREMLNILKETAESSNVVQLRRIVSSMEISYYMKLGDAEKVSEHLAEQYNLAEQQQMERNRIYQYSIDLINIMEEQRKEQDRMRQENEMLHSQVKTDPLTGIPNRLKLDELLPELFKHAQKDSHFFAVSLMDINKFKDYNDTYGHLAGDICLQKIAKAIQDVSDKSGVQCARYGGDEFIMLYENKTDEEIRKIAKELRDSVYALSIPHESMDEGRVSISQGIFNGVPSEHHRQEDFLNEADTALYAVKKMLDSHSANDYIRLVNL